MPISIVHNQVNSANQQDVASFNITVPAPTNGNNLILGIMQETTDALYPPVGFISSITQTGAAWVKATSQIFGSIDTEIWYAENVSGAGTTITINVNIHAGAWVTTYAEVNGLITSLSLDKIATSTWGDGDAPTTGLTATTTAPNELWFGFIANYQKFGTFPGLSGPNNGFSILNEANAQRDPAEHFTTSGSFINIVSSIGTASCSCSPNVNNGGAGLIATFKALTPPIVCPVFNTAADFITELRNRFAEINFAPWIDDTQLIRWINLGLDDIAFRTLPPRYEMFPPFEINSIGGQVSYDLPADYFRLKEFGDTSGLFFNGNALLFEDKTAEMEEFKFGVGLMPTNNPIWFWFWSKKFFLYPPPADNSGIIKMYYYRLPIYVCVTTDTIDLDRPWEEVLMKFVLWHALEKDKHPMSQVYRQEYEQALSNQYSESRVRVEKRARYVHSHDYWGREDR